MGEHRSIWWLKSIENGMKQITDVYSPIDCCLYTISISSYVILIERERCVHCTHNA